MHNLALTKTLPLLMKRQFAYGSDGINPTQLSKQTGVNQSTIHRILAGESKDPRRSTVETLAAFLGVSYEQIYDVDYIRNLVLTGEIREDGPHYGSRFDVEKLRDGLLALPEDERQEAAKFLLDAILDPKNLESNSARHSSDNNP